MANTKTTEIANEAFENKLASINYMLEELKKITNQNFYQEPKTIDWGHVGFVSDIEQKLHDIYLSVFDENGDVRK